MGDFDHAKGSGHVAAKRGDYWDALERRKARVHLLVHENLGGMSAYAARRLRRLGRLAKEWGTDGTDYSKSYTARSFVPYYAQRISHSIVINGAQAILNGIAKATKSRLRMSSA